MEEFWELFQSVECFKQLAQNMTKFSINQACIYLHIYVIFKLFMKESSHYIYLINFDVIYRYNRKHETDIMYTWLHGHPFLQSKPHEPTDNSKKLCEPSV